MTLGVLRVKTGREIEDFVSKTSLQGRPERQGRQVGEPLGLGRGRTGLFRGQRPGAPLCVSVTAEPEYLDAETHLCISPSLI